MKPGVLLTVVLLAFLGGDYILDVVGYPHHDFNSSFVFRLHPLTYLASFLILYYLKLKKLKFSDFFSKMRNETVFLSVCLIIICYLGLVRTLNSISFLLDALCLPAILSILLKITEQNTLFKFQKLVYVCFFLNASLAIIEKIIGASLLSDGSYYFKDYFRATAIYGHPLNNALIMGVLTVILFFSSKSTALKITVLISGLLSIICFGARGALVGVFLSIAANQVSTFFNLKKKKLDYTTAKKDLFYLGIIAVIGFIIINFTGLGDRIVALAYVDSSAASRINAFSVLRGIDFSDLLWGFETSEINHFQHNAGVQEIENFWIQWILRFGLVATVFLAIFLFRFLYRMMAFVKKDIKITLLFVFVFVASTNNSLSTNTMALSILVLTCYIFFDSKGKEKEVKVPQYAQFVYRGSK